MLSLYNRVRKFQFKLCCYDPSLPCVRWHHTLCQRTYHSVLWLERWISDLEQRVIISVDLRMLGCCAEAVEHMQVIWGIVRVLKVGLDLQKIIPWTFEQMIWKCQEGLWKFKGGINISGLCTHIFFIKTQLQMLWKRLTILLQILHPRLVMDALKEQIGQEIWWSFLSQSSGKYQWWNQSFIWKYVMCYSSN